MDIILERKVELLNIGLPNPKNTESLIINMIKNSMKNLKKKRKKQQETIIEKIEKKY